MHRTVLAALVALAGLLARPASAQDSTLTRLIRRNQLPLTVSGTQYGGAGWSRLLADLQQSHLVAVGEAHGLAQIPPFTAALAREFNPGLYVGEVDSYVAQKLTELAAQPGEPTDYLRYNPGGLAFGTMAEEFDLIRGLRARNTRIAGIDQVFAMTAGPFYDLLAEARSSSRSAQAYFEQQALRYRIQDLANERLNNHYYALPRQTPGSIDSLLAFTKNGNARAQQLAQDYVTSYRIYTGKEGSHQRRLNLMKRNLLRELQPYQTAAGLNTPRVLLKLGGVHLGRGLSPIGFGDFYDVGNLVQNLADAQDKKSLHLLVLGKQGRMLTSFNLKFPDKLSTAYTEADNDNEIPIKAFTDQVSGPAWSVFDLRPLRDALGAGQLQLPRQALRRIVEGYDYLIIIPETTASRPM